MTPLPVNLFYIKPVKMNIILKLEELAMLISGILFFNFLAFEWWWFPLLFLVPDLGMTGYAFGNRAGAMAYNIFHHKGVAILGGLSGLCLGNEALQLAGLIIFSHAAFDRMLGYGLKYDKGFKFTHLGEIGYKKTVAG